MKLLAKLLAVPAAVVALCAIPQGAAAQTGTAPYCLQAGGVTRCVFGTMGECEQARGSSSIGQCMTRTDAQGTTGLGEPLTNPLVPAPGPPAPAPER